MAQSKYGVTIGGFVRPRLPEIKAEIESELSAALGVVINTRPDSVFGQIIGVFSEREAIFWDVAEATYYAMYPHTADGVSLTNAVAFTGVRPVSAEKTSLIATCYGVNNTTIPAGSRIKSAVDEAITLSSTTNSKISLQNASYADIVLLTVAAATLYTMTIDGTTYSYTSTGSDTAASILISLAAQMSAIGGVADVSNNHLIITKSDQRSGYAISLSTNMQATEVGTPIEFLCDSYGSIDPAIGTVTQIVTQIAGWNRCANNVAAVVGRDNETGTELRQRYGRSVYRKGAALIEAIAAKIYEDVDGVTAAITFENDTDETDADGRPPHSIEVVVQGGDEATLAKTIWQNKAPGIQTLGTTAVDIYDSQGVKKTIKFNRPVAKKVWIKVQITKDTDEDFPGDTPSQVQRAIYNEGLTYTIGKDVILQRFAGTIYKNTIGIGYVTITAAVSETPPSAYTINNIAISPREIADFSLDRIEVTVL